mgnify:CR=1 FL=1
MLAMWWPVHRQLASEVLRSRCSACSCPSDEHDQHALVTLAAETRDYSHVSATVTFSASPCRGGSERGVALMRTTLVAL